MLLRLVSSVSGDSGTFTHLRMSDAIKYRFPLNLKTLEMSKHNIGMKRNKQKAYDVLYPT